MDVHDVSSIYIIMNINMFSGVSQASLMGLSDWILPDNDLLHTQYHGIFKRIRSSIFKLFCVARFSHLTLYLPYCKVAPYNLEGGQCITIKPIFH